MARKELNLGIVAHVDAGKTTLTERLLYAAGVIDALGSVDAGTTQTDSLDLERRRGITIRTAVASFEVGDTHVNLIDTPGHPDFIAEVERALRVLDGAILVVSAVEGVQPQTRILLRALERLQLPAVVFVNKTDRAGADVDRVLDQIGNAALVGTPRLVDLLAELDEDVLAHYPDVPDDVVLRSLARQPVFPALSGSALRGDGVDELLQALPALLPVEPGDDDAPLAATVFKIERAANGEKVAYVRLHAGTLRARQQLEDGKVTALAVFEHGGTPTQRTSVAAGGVAKVWGLADVEIGDIGASTARHEFPPPTLEAVVVPRDAHDAPRLHVALAELAEQDPLIDVRQDDEHSVSLYGEVQQQVLEATLREEYGLDVEFRDPTVIHVERPTGVGEALEILNAPTNPFSAEVGLRIEPAAAGHGVEFRLDVGPRWIPLYVYKSVELFTDDMTRSVKLALQAGLYGWRVTDCVVTLTRCNYASADGPPSQRGSLSMPGDYRGLTPLVLARALEHAGTVVCEPILHVTLEVPASTLGAVLGALGRLGATVETPSLDGSLALVETTLPAVRTAELQRELPRVTSGEGVFESTFAGYRPVAGEPPTRRLRRRTSA